MANTSPSRAAGGRGTACFRSLRRQRRQRRRQELATVSRLTESAVDVGNSDVLPAERRGPDENVDRHEQRVEQVNLRRWRRERRWRWRQRWRQRRKLRRLTDNMASSSCRRANHADRGAVPPAPIRSTRGAQSTGGGGVRVSLGKMPPTNTTRRFSRCRYVCGQRGERPAREELATGI